VKREFYFSSIHTLFNCADSQEKNYRINHQPIVSDESIESDEIKKRLAERRKGHSSKYNMTIKEKSGKKILVSVYASPVINASKKFIGSLLCIKDIDRQKQEEEGIEEEHGEFGIGSRKADKSTYHCELSHGVRNQRAKAYRRSAQKQRETIQRPFLQFS
jgi:hypothetical protein